MKSKDLNNNLTWYWYKQPYTGSDLYGQYFISCCINGRYYYHYEHTINYSMFSERTKTYGYFNSLDDVLEYAGQNNLPIAEGSKN